MVTGNFVKKNGASPLWSSSSRSWADVKMRGLYQGPFIVDSPIEHGDFPVRYVTVYQRGKTNGCTMVIVSLPGFLCW